MGTGAGDVGDSKLDSARLWSALRTTACAVVAMCGRIAGPTRGATVMMVAVLSSVRMGQPDVHGATTWRLRLLHRHQQTTVYKIVGC